MTIPTEPIGSIPRPIQLIAAQCVRLDFAEGRFAMKIDPVGELLTSFIELDNLALGRIPLAHFGAGDDCGFSPFCDDTSMQRDTAFAKITARVQGTALASHSLGLTA